ncbi:ATP-binding protein [Streptomyces sp. NPDC088915]|uniref:ATP-binding protein n=1 Tax=Streptomyces sp. NPDC088915 TaxID=3365912 RepID=UPI0038205491
MAMTLAVRDEAALAVRNEAETPAEPPLHRAVMSVMKILQSRGMDPTINGEEEYEDRPDSIDEYQLQVNRRAWTNSLVLCDLTAYERFTLGRLDAAQHPDRLRWFVDTLVTVRRHNRAQLQLPAEQRKKKTPKRLNGIVSGNIGTGKTAAAIAAGAYGVEQGLMVRVVSHSRYLSWLRPDSAPAGLTPGQIKERYQRCDLLILDEACNELDGYASTFVRTETADLLSARLHTGKGTLLTTNLNSDQIAEVLGERFASRLGSQASLFDILGEDRRQPIRW